MTIALRSAVEEYLETRERSGKADNTMRVDTTLLPRFAEHLGNPDFSQLSAKQVRDFFYGPGGIMDAHSTRIKGQPIREAVGPSTHNNYRARLKVFFTYCKNSGFTELDNYLTGVEPLPELKKRRQQPPPSLLLQLLDQAECAMHRAYLATAINTACRASEITGMRVGDVDFARSEVFVTVVKTREEDEMPLTADLERELRLWLVEYAELLGRPLRADDYLFPARTGNTISTHYLDEATGQRVYVRTPFVWHPDRPVQRTEKIVKHALGAVGLPTRYEGTHTIRRAVARAYFDSLSTELGYDAGLRTVSALLHHSNMATTERYLGLSSERRRRDETMKGKAFLTAMVSQENVVPLRRAQ
ncbi:tyrosine-type recombinase/integrase [Streptomyces sp. NPDC091879]|uniref:tyrosine-type recombinase/integrase n=1 Tax=Streptomyces sp. NPDC091879 TaxID=3366006 RepID=UPI00380CBD1A